jgi:uncharacterized C2H2 Zn-finger protein
MQRIPTILRYAFLAADGKWLGAADTLPIEFASLMPPPQLQWQAPRTIMITIDEGERYTTIWEAIPSSSVPMGTAAVKLRAIFPMAHSQDPNTPCTYCAGGKCVLVAGKCLQCSRLAVGPGLRCSEHEREAAHYAKLSARSSDTTPTSSPLRSTGVAAPALAEIEDAMEIDSDSSSEYVEAEEEVKKRSVPRPTSAILARRKKLHCDRCIVGKSFATQKELDRHVEEMHVPLRHKRPGWFFACVVCDAQFPSREACDDHVDRTHSAAAQSRARSQQ